MCVQVIKPVEQYIGKRYAIDVCASGLVVVGLMQVPPVPPARPALTLSASRAVKALESVRVRAGALAVCVL